MKYAIKRTDGASRPYGKNDGKYGVAYEAATVEDAYLFSSMDEAVQAVLRRGHAYGSRPSATIVGVRELPQPRLEEVPL